MSRDLFDDLTIAHSGLERHLSFLRIARRERERAYRTQIDYFVAKAPLSSDAERAVVDTLQSRVIDVADAQDRQPEVEKDFPSRTFMFHGATTKKLIEILRSGNLVNAHALGHGRGENGGEEGISWSLGDIEAIPSTRYHMAGFMAAPEVVLGVDSQLAIPDSPAPYEVVQLSSNVDAAQFYEARKQEHVLDVVYECFADFATRSRKLEDIEPYDIAQYISYDNNDGLVFSEEFAKKAHELGGDFVIPLWLKAIGLRGVNLDEKLADKIAADLEERILSSVEPLPDDDTNSNDVAVPVDKLYFVAPRKDLDDWLRVLARCGNKPKGIITYDGSSVRLEDFATEHRGDGGELAGQLRQVVKPQADTLQWQTLLGRPYGAEMKHDYVVSSWYLDKTKCFELNAGKLVEVR